MEAVGCPVEAADSLAEDADYPAEAADILAVVDTLAVAGILAVVGTLEVADILAEPVPAGSTAARCVAGSACAAAWLAAAGNGGTVAEPG